MTNREMFENYERIAKIKEVEKNYFKKTGEKLLKGRMKVSYAINKNKAEFQQKLKPCEETREELIREYRDVEAEQEALKEKQEKEKQRAELEGREPEIVSINIILRNGKDLKEYEKKLKELFDIEVDVDIHCISIEQLEGLDLDSPELELFMFMIED